LPRLIRTWPIHTTNYLLRLHIQLFVWFTWYTGYTHATIDVRICLAKVDTLYAQKAQKNVSFRNVPSAKNSVFLMF
jgi:hypothetical protein